MIYAKGLYVNRPKAYPDGAMPKNLIATISIKAMDLVNWLSENEGLINEKGYIYLKVREGQDGSYYAHLDEPKKKDDTPAVAQPKNDVDDDVPF